MNETFILVRTDHDPLTAISHEEAQVLLDAAEKKMVEVMDVSGREATRCHVQDCFIKVPSGNVCTVVIYAHGDPTTMTITGQCQHRAMFDSENVYLFNKKGVFAGACFIARKLGRNMLLAGAPFFIGFQKRILLPPGREGEIIDCINAGALSLINEPNNPEAACAAILRTTRELEENLRKEIVRDIRMGIAIIHIRKGLVCMKPDEPDESFAKGKGRRESE